MMRDAFTRPIGRCCLWLAWMFVVGLAGIARADQLPMTDAEAEQLCAGDTTLPWAAALEKGMAGYWVDGQNQRGAISWDVLWNDARDQLKVIVYTYDSRGRPIWLATSMTSLEGVGQPLQTRRTWHAKLFKYTASTLSNPTQVGSVAVTFLANDPTRLAMRWDWNALTSGVQTECLNNYITIDAPTTSGVTVPRSPTQPLAYTHTGVNQPFSGYWNGDGGVNTVPAMSMHIVQPTFPEFDEAHPSIAIHQPPGIYVEHNTLLTFDSTGEPVFLVASLASPLCSGPPSGRYAESMPCDPPLNVNTGNLFYPQPNTAKYPQGFPYFTSCERDCVGSADIGDVSRTVALVPGTSGSVGVQNLLAPPADVYGGGQQTLGNFWPSSSSGINKATGSYDIVPVQLACQTTPPATCTIWVAWHSSTVTKLYRHDLADDTYTYLASSDLNEYIDALSAYDRVQYELWSGDPPTGTRLDFTAEVRGYPLPDGTGVPPLPDSPIMDNSVDLGTHDPTVGTTPGEADTEGGAATARFPIEVPPGRRDLQPDFALTYSSRAGNGIAGLGWSLSGASSIHRCPRTIAQDGVAGTVTFEGTDRLCLDGQRLVAESGSSYGTSGASYRTEIESFTRVTQSGSIAAGAGATFTVVQKNGRTLTYGGDNAHCGSGDTTRGVVPPGATANQLSWLLRSVTDPVGNRIDYCYQAGGVGETLLSKVYYTGTASVVGTRHVDFTYEVRPTSGNANDIASSFISGTEVAQTKRLSTIATFVGATAVYTYKLAYVTSQHSGRSLLSSFQQCVPPNATVCKAATTLSWDDGVVDHLFKPFVISSIPDAAPSLAHPRQVATIGDLDGDGSRELLVSQSDGVRMHAYLAKVDADRSQQGTPVEVTTMFPSGVVADDLSTDFDGDGRVELVRALEPVSTVHFRVWNLLRGAPLPGGSCDTGCTNLFTDFDTGVPLLRNTGLKSIDRIVATDDLNGDGYPDLVLVRYANGCSDNTATPSPILCVYLNQPTLGRFKFSGGSKVVGGGFLTLQRADFNGDGIRDIVFSTCDKLICNGQLPTFLLSRGAGMPMPAGCTAMMDATYWSCPGAALGIQPGFGFDTSSQQFVDINGDGLTDLLFANVDDSCTVHASRSPAPVSHGVLCAQINTGRGFAPIVTITPDDDTKVLLARDQRRFRYFGRMPITDVDSDGKPDLLYPRQFAARVCRLESVTYTQTNSLDCPIGASCEIWFCPEDVEADHWPAPHPPGGGPAIANFDGRPIFGMYSHNGLPAGSDAPDTANDDNSAYVLGAVHIVQDASGGWRAFATSLDASSTLGTGHVAVGSFNSLNTDQDLYGDGLSDTIANIGCLDTIVANCHVLADGIDGPANLPDGRPASALTTTQQVISENVGNGARGSSAPIPPELLHQVTNGLGDYTRWSYYPLSSKAGRISVRKPLYTLTGNYVDSEQYPFTSSMPVVASMVQNNPGILGARSWIYGYEDAVYNRNGRGFQGFGAIVATQAAAGAVQPLQTATHYLQKFPLAGQVSSREVGLPAADGTSPLTPLSTDTFAWICSQSDADPSRTPGSCGNVQANKSYFVALDRSVTATYDLASAQAGQQKAVGETRTFNATVAAPIGGLSGWDRYGNLKRQIVLRRDLTDVADGGAYVDTETTDASMTYKPADMANWWLDRLDTKTVTKAITYRDTTVPVGANPNAGAVTTATTWNEDRTLKRSIVTGGTSTITDIAYPSPSYGLPQSITLSGTGTDGSALAARTTTFGYSGDGYFVETTQPMPGHSTTTQHRSADGQVEKVVADTGLVTWTRFDALGNPTRTDFYESDGQSFVQPSVRHAMKRCSPCSGTGESGASYVVTTTQDGAPTQKVWLDHLRRPLKTAERGLDSTWINTLITYDTMGNVRTTTAPAFEGAAASTTTFTYDALNRMASKVQPPSDIGGTVTTTYTYAGNRTDITVREASQSCAAPSSLCFSMKRYASITGKLMRTVDAIGGNTQFWYDGAGRTIAALDAKAIEPMIMTYNAVGHRIAIDDPNQGQWTFRYNAAGELIGQTDARNVVTTRAYDALGRMTQQTTTPPTPTPAAIEPGVTTDVWNWDAPGANGLLENLTRSVGGSARWSEAYEYDTHTKRLAKRQTTILGEAVPFITQYRYDTHYGRVKSITYPSGFSVWKQYGGPDGDFGDLTALADAGSLAPLWGLYQSDARRQPTLEQYGYALRGTATYTNATGQMKSREWKTVSGNALVDQVGYTYDALGNLVEQKRKLSDAQAASSTTYTYDALQRLTGSGGAGGTIGYAYDAVGNFTKKTDYSANRPTPTTMRTRAADPTSSPRWTRPRVARTTTPATPMAT